MRAVHFLHLAALWTLAVAQPLLDVLGRNAEFFAIRRSQPEDIVLFAIGLVLLPPLLLFAIEAVAERIDARAGRITHLALVAGLSALLALLVLKRTGATSAVLVPVCLLAGAAAAALYARIEPIRSFLTVLAAAPVVVVLLFLFNTPVHRLVSGDDAEAALAADGGRAPVVMIVLDELPLTSLLGSDGRIDAGRYPNFARLARGSTWFRNTSSVDAQTQVAVPAVMTGRLPTSDELPTLEDHPHNVFTLLGRGRRFNVHESVTQLCPQELCGDERSSLSARMRSLLSDLGVVGAHVLAPEDVRRRLPSIDSSWQDFLGDDDEGRADRRARGGRGNAASVFLDIFEEQGADRDRLGVTARFIAGVPRRRTDAPGGLSFLHVLLPHVPWLYEPHGKRYGNAAPVAGLDEERWGPDQGAATVGLQRHLLQVAFVDRLLGVLLDRLRRNGTYDESLIVVTADHGAAFRASAPRREVVRRNAVDILPVPLFLKAPRQRRGQVRDTHLQTVDVLPTMASLLGLRIPWRVDGRSGFAAGADRRTLTTTNSGRRPVRLSARRLDALRAAALRRQVDLVGEGIFPQPAGAHGRSLLGRSVAGAARRPAGASASIDNAVAYTAVSPGSAFVPTHVSGRLKGTDAREVAIGVGGRVRAVTPVIRDGDDRRFSAMLPVSALRRGSNRVQVLAVVPDAGGTDLVALADTGEATRYAIKGQTVRGPAGRRYRIVAGSILGGVDSSFVRDGDVTLSGWAVGAGKTGPVDAIVGFQGGRLLFSGPPSGPRADIAMKERVPPEDLAFSFQVREDSLDGPPTILAVRDGVASRLSWFCGGRQAIGC